MNNPAATSNSRADGTLPRSVLFSCDHNAVRSPIAEAIMKNQFGKYVFVQSAAAKQPKPIDGFAVAAAQEMGLDLSNHRERSFDNMEAWGEQVTRL